MFGKAYLTYFLVCQLELFQSVTHDKENILELLQNSMTQTFDENDVSAATTFPNPSYGLDNGFTHFGTQHVNVRKTDDDIGIASDASKHTQACSFGQCKFLLTPNPCLMQDAVDRNNGSESVAAIAQRTSATCDSALSEQWSYNSSAEAGSPVALMRQSSWSASNLALDDGSSRNLQHVFLSPPRAATVALVFRAGLNLPACSIDAPAEAQQ
jgi:hypothetical protein